MHTPGLKTPGGWSSNPPTPHLGPLPTSGSTTALTATATPTTISSFMLDSRAPPGQSYQEQEAVSERQTEEEARRLMAETKLWRLANSAMWVAWGIVQAHVPGLPDFDAEEKKTQGESESAAQLDGATAEVQAKAGADEQNEAVSQEKVEGIEDKMIRVGEDTDLFKSQEDEEFDYLAYSQDRAMFVWGDAILLGLIKAEELPEELVKRVKLVDF
jgi:choline kinase